MKHASFSLILTLAILASPTPAGADGAIQIAGGADHTCALTAAGAVVCWGANIYGQLGNGSRTDSLTPAPVTGLSSGVQAIAAGQYHTCALTAAGAVVCWGYNAEGELGNGTTDDSLTPVPVVGLDAGARAISAGGYHSCALTAAGAAVCWGGNWFGQLGDGTTNDSATPVHVSGLSSGVRAIATGGYYSCAITPAGGAACWGGNLYGQLGNATADPSSVPVAVNGLAAGVAGIAAGWDHTCAVTTGGSALCWGSNWYGALGDGTTEDRLAPTPVVGLDAGAAAVTAGGYHTCALTTAGGVLCWGAVGYPGSGDPPDYDVTPAAVTGLESGVAMVDAGGFHACVVTTIGSAACWGYNAWGQLGDQSTVDSLLPVQVFGLEGGAPAPGDFTGDGTSDILWRHTTGGDMWLWPMAGGAKAADAYVGTVADTNWEIRGQGDLDGDGTADLLWRHKLDGTIYYWRMLGGQPVSELYVATVDVAYDIAGTADFDGDRKADILWRNPAAGDLWLWRMNGAELLGQAYVDTADLSYAIKGLGDLNGDLKTDVVWQGAAGDIWVWLMNGSAKDAQSHVGTVADTTYEIQRVADFDADARADLLWRNTVAGDVWIWRMNGAAVVSEHLVGLVANTNYRIQSAGDFNGDGKADVLWRNIVAGDLWVWLMNGPAKASETYLGIVADQGYQVVR